MNKLGRLIRNELIKKTKQPSTIILAAIFIVICTITPFIIKLSQYDYYNDYDPIQSEIENYTNRYQWVKEGQNNIELPDYIINQYDDVINFLNKFIGKDITNDDWRFNIITEINNTIQSNYVIGLILNEKINLADKEQLQYLEDPSGLIYQAQEINKEELQEIFDENQAHIEKMTKIIEVNDYTYYISSQIDSAKIEIESLDKQLVVLKEKQSKTPSKETESEIAFIESQLEYVKGALIIHEFRLSNSIPLDGDWKDKTLKTLDKTLNEIKSTKDQIRSMRESDNDNYYDYDGLTSEYRIKINEKILVELTNKVDVYWESINNNTPEMDVVSSSRSSVQNYLSFTIFSAIIALFIAASMVSGEFSTKTINMLVIRPVKRWKILTAKYITVLIFAYGVYLIGLLGYMLSTGISLGFADFAYPYMFAGNGTVHNINFFVYMLLKVLMHSSNIVFLVTLVFMMSTLTKNTALSAITGMGVYFFSSIATSIIAFIAPKLIHVLKYTFIPYVDLNNLTSDQGNMMSYIFDPTYGMIHLFVLSAIMFAISLAVFNKRDIK